ncbi:hypothetical protein BDN72DRAFT_838499 [Pluteus cervinus]|uniref:Uncharacterized protein n=1 Tax=Pluteus cervinus TaxID=181527 RepID=A0ACD3AYG9_9AGAR|nr:hypothetical protein BDN72DRAFT_838499 [Pluteus cervinus]
MDMPRTLIQPHSKDPPSPTHASVYVRDCRTGVKKYFKNLEEQTSCVLFFPMLGGACVGCASASAGGS